MYSWLIFVVWHFWYVLSGLIHCGTMVWMMHQSPGFPTQISCTECSFPLGRWSLYSLVKQLQGGTWFCVYFKDKMRYFRQSTIHFWMVLEGVGGVLKGAEFSCPSVFLLHLEHIQVLWIWKPNSVWGLHKLLNKKGIMYLPRTCKPYLYPCIPFLANSFLVLLKYKLFSISWDCVQSLGPVKYALTHYMELFVCIISCKQELFSSASYWSQ